jgi:hypothetical protein
MSALAWSIAPGLNHPYDAALKARFRGLNVPDIQLVKIDAPSTQQVAIFLLKNASAMVLLLRLDVLQHTSILLRLTMVGAKMM